MLESTYAVLQKACQVISVAPDGRIVKDPAASNSLRVIMQEAET